MFFRVSSVLLALLLLFLTSACGLFSRTTRMSRTDDQPTRQVGLLPLELGSLQNNDALRQALQKDFQIAFNKACPHIRIVELTGPARPATGSPFVLQYDPEAMVQNGRELGVQAIVRNGLASLERVTERRSLLFWMRRDVLQGVFFMSVLDMQSGTQLHSGILEASHSVGELNPSTLNENSDWAVPELRHKLRRELERLGQQACRSIAPQPWHTFITSEKGTEAPHQLILPVGQAAALTVGDELTVYALEPVIKSYDGLLLSVPGPAAGRIRLTAVHEHHSTAVLVSGRAAVGDLVMARGGE